MKQKQYTMTELESKSGFPRRTIHFYSQEGIISPPFGTGGAAKYGETHLLRLKLVKILKKSHLKLSGIKEALDAMEIDEMRNLLMTSEQNSSWENISIENWITSDDKRSSFLSKDKVRNESDIGQELFSMSEVRTPMRTYESEPDAQNYLRSLKRKTNVKTRWERYSILDGIEISIRSDVNNSSKSLVHKLIEEIKNKLM